MDIFFIQSNHRNDPFKNIEQNRQQGNTKLNESKIQLVKVVDKILHTDSYNIIENHTVTYC